MEMWKLKDCEKRGQENKKDEGGRKDNLGQVGWFANPVNTTEDNDVRTRAAWWRRVARIENVAKDVDVAFGCEHLDAGILQRLTHDRTHRV